MSDIPDERPRIAGFNDEQLAQADKRIETLVALLEQAEDLKDAGVVTSAQIADIQATLDQAKKIRKIMNIRLPG